MADENDGNTTDVIGEDVREDHSSHPIFYPEHTSPNIRDEQSLMEFPFFSLEKRIRTKPIILEHPSGTKVIVRGIDKIGIATIFDADFLIWCASQIMTALDRGEAVSPRIFITPNKFFVQTRRTLMGPKKTRGGKDYEKLKGLLRRLQSTSIETNIKAGGEMKTGAWSWIDHWTVHSDEKTKRLKYIEVVLGDWFFTKLLKDRSILSISPLYFEIPGGTERWLYKIARKHTGSQDIFSIKFETLYAKYPSGLEFRKFRYELKQIVNTKSIPEYNMRWDEKEGKVFFWPKDGTIERRKLPRTLRDEAYPET